MRVLTIIAVLLVFGTAAPMTAGAQTSGQTTVNLRTCIDAGDAACLTSGDVAVDGVLVCLRRSGRSEQCAATEDGEAWWDSLRHGSYVARVVVPSGYELAGASCTTWPNVPYSPCQVKGDSVHVVVQRDVVAVSVGFLLTPS